MLAGKKPFVSHCRISISKENCGLPKWKSPPKTQATPEQNLSQDSAPERTEWLRPPPPFLIPDR